MTLNDLKIGDVGVITAVGGKGALRRRLLDMGLTPKTRIFVRKMAPLGDPIEIQLRGYELTLRKDDADNIEVGGHIPHQPPHHGGCGHRGCGHRGCHGWFSKHRQGEE